MGGRHGIEASPTDQGQSEWGCYTVEVAGAESQEVGAGKTNTNAILDGGCVQDYVYSGDIAARIAYAVSPGRDDSLQKAQGNLPIRSAR